MKTAEVIRLLQEADPTGETECCVENADIFFVDVQPAYYDGYLQVLKRDPTSKCYDVVGAKYTAKGQKVVIKVLTISDAIFEQEDLPVEFEDLSPGNADYYRKLVEDRRALTRKVCDDVELASFNEYLFKRLRNFSEDFDEDVIREAAREFYAGNMSYLDTMPVDIAKRGMPDRGESGLSWNQRRCLQWDREIRVDFVGGKLTLCKISQ